MGILNVINVKILKLFELPLLQETIIVSHPMDIIPNFQHTLDKGTTNDNMPLILLVLKDKLQHRLGGYLPLPCNFNSLI